MSVAVAPEVEVVARVEVEARHRVAAVFPVYEVVRLQDGHSWKYKHRRGHHIIRVTYADDVGVREVGIDHRVGVSAVAIVAVPFLRFRRITAQDQGDGGNYGNKRSKHARKGLSVQCTIIDISFESRNRKFTDVPEFVLPDEMDVARAGIPHGLSIRAFAVGRDESGEVGVIKVGVYSEFTDGKFS